LIKEIKELEQRDVHGAEAKIKEIIRTDLTSGMVSERIRSTGRRNLPYSGTIPYTTVLLVSFSFVHKAWLRLRGSMESAVREVKQKRLKEERKLLLESREMACEAAFGMYKRKTPASTWGHWPAGDVIHEWIGVDDLINAEGDSKLDAELLAVKIEEVCSVKIEEWRMQEKYQLLYKMRDYPTELEVLDLAVAVFSCAGTPFVLPLIYSHLCSRLCD
jgi:hypothetical protein